MVLLRVLVGAIGFGVIDWSYGFAENNPLLAILGIIIILLSTKIEG